MNRMLMGLTLVSLCMGPINANAEPDRVTQWLIDTPLSRWDFGMKKLNDQLDSIKKPGEIDPIAFHDWDEDRIIIMFSVHSQKFDSAKCGELLNGVKKLGGVKEDGSLELTFTSKELVGLNHSSFANNFVGSKTTTQPKDYLNRVDDKVDITVLMTGGGCKSPLRSDKVTFSH